jgi:hypothetical protein
MKRNSESSFKFQPVVIYLRARSYMASHDIENTANLFGCRLLIKTARASDPLTLLVPFGLGWCCRRDRSSGYR